MHLETLKETLKEQDSLVKTKIKHLQYMDK